MSSIDFSKLNDFAGILGLVVVGALAFDQFFDDNDNRMQKLEHKLDLVLMTITDLEDENEELARRANMTLWIERARRADTLADLPAFPSPSSN
jgi:hypothetical protein